MENMHRARYGERGVELHALSNYAILSESQCIHQPGSSPYTILVGIYKASSHRHGWLTHWPSAVELNIQSLSSPRTEVLDQPKEPLPPVN